MATGGAVVCTDAHGNRDYCVDGVNCLMPDATPAAVAAALRRALDDPGLRRRLGEAGRTTAAGYDWATRINALERSFYTVARPRRLEVLGDPRSNPIEHPEAERKNGRNDRDRTTSANVEPNNAVTLGVADVMNACRNC